MMKKLWMMAAFLFTLTSLSAQTSGVVKWQFSARKISDLVYELHLTPTVQAPWHIYSQHSPEGGAVPTSFQFAKNPLATLDGPVKESGNIVRKYEEVFGVTVQYFKGNVDFVQTVRLKTKVKTTLSGSLEYMACNDNQCLPPATVPFSITLQ